MKTFNSGKQPSLVRNSSRSDASGFTLLELLVSLLLLSVSFMAIIPLLLNTMSLNNKTNMATIARDLATQKVEQLMTTDRSVLSGLVDPTTRIYQSPNEYLTATGVATVATDPAAYQRNWDVREVDPTGQQTPKPVILTSVVQYKYKGLTKSRSFSTMWSF